MNFLNLLAATILAIAVAGCGKQESTEATTAETEKASTVATAIESPAADEAALQVQGDYMRGIVAEISDDRYEGRGPGTRGDEMARRYLAEQMAALGLEPGAEDGSWEQYFDLVGINATQPESWTFSGPESSLTLEQWDQFIVGSGVQRERATVKDAEVVFVGYGMQAPEYDWD
ncbi:MAG: hypothetical protein WBM61_11850, partial [Woeseiaceae bacterium]